jgi:hypothetical protein
MPKYVVKVTQEDIDSGRPRVPMQCPVALAVSRSLGGSGFVIAGPRSIHINRGSLITPPEARKFMRRFDDGAPIEPFEFTIDTDVIFVCDDPDDAIDYSYE